MSPRLLKEGSSVLAIPYSILFNSSLQQGEFPSQWKEANVTCIHKKTTVPSPQITDPSHFSAKLAKSWNDVCIKNYTTSLTHITY